MTFGLNVLTRLEGHRGLISQLKTGCIFWVIVCAPFFSGWVYSAETVIEVEQKTIDRSSAVKTAIKRVSQELIERFIEPSKLKAQKKRIQKIISAYSNRYILYTKTSAPLKKGPSAFIFNITIGFSEENLKKFCYLKIFFTLDLLI